MINSCLRSDLSVSTRPMSFCAPSTTVSRPHLIAHTRTRYDARQYAPYRHVMWQAMRRKDPGSHSLPAIAEDERQKNESTWLLVKDKPATAVKPGSHERHFKVMGLDVTPELIAISMGEQFGAAMHWESTAHGPPITSSL